MYSYAAATIGQSTRMQDERRDQRRLLDRGRRGVLPLDGGRNDGAAVVFNGWQWLGDDDPVTPVAAA